MTSSNHEPHLEKILQIPSEETGDVTTQMGVFIGYKVTELGMQEEYLGKSSAAREGLQDVTPFLTKENKITRAEKLHIIEKHTVGDLAKQYRDYLVENAFYSSNFTRSPDGELIYSLHVYDQGMRLREWLTAVDKLVELAKSAATGCVIWSPPEMPPLFETRLRNLLQIFFDSIDKTDDDSWKLHLKGHRPLVVAGGQILAGVFIKSK